MNMFTGHSCHSLLRSLLRCTVFLLCSFFLMVPLAVQAASNPDNAHVLRRLESPERMRAIEEATRIDKAAREAFARKEAVTPAAPSLRAETTARETASASENPLSSSPSPTTSTDSLRSQSVTEVLFNYAAGFAGVPGLAPQRGVDGSLDEGLGFHQDGTARKAGGVAGALGTSDRSQRARTYMQSGLQKGYGSGFGQGNGLYDAQFGDLWGRNAPTRGGRIGAGVSYSRELGDFDPFNMAIDRGLNYGAGFVNSMGEAALSGLVDGGRARLNFRLDRDGYFSGEGDTLLPFYDSARTTIYTQLGARSIRDSSDTRWIGNFGLGQRWFPLASGEDHKAADYDAGTLMLGYNAFFDYDFTRYHQRGGIGAEVWYDWLRLSSNYYFPLSDWRGSKDFDSHFVEERPAEGWDARVKAYLPFYRNVALTGAYSQWYGERVGMFGADPLEKDPKVWSYGIEYTPVPLVSGFITQKSTEHGRSATEFGMTFTYHFQMPWEEQISYSKVAELRTVGGSRHEFVDRENRIILEYKANGCYHIEYLGLAGTNVFRFRLFNGFNENASRQHAVAVITSGATFAGGASSQYCSTDGNGEFFLSLETVTSSPTVTIQTECDSQTFTLKDARLTTVLSIIPETLPPGMVGTPYSQELIGNGGTGPYSFALTSGSSLPSWLTLNGSTLSGTPTAPGTFNFSLTVTDTATAQTAEQAFTLTVGSNRVVRLVIITQPVNVPSASSPASMTVEARDANNNPVANVDIGWKITTAGGSGTATPFDFNTRLGTITASGTGQVTGNIPNTTYYAGSSAGLSGILREAQIIAYVIEEPSISVTSNTISFGGASFSNNFITGPARRMSGNAADAFCRDQGGQLPTAGLSAASPNVPNVSANGDFITGETLPFLSTLGGGDFWTRDWSPSPLNDRWVVFVSSSGRVNTGYPDVTGSSILAACVR